MNQNRIEPDSRTDIEELIRKGTLRLREAAAGRDFYQAVPEQPPYGDTLQWYWKNFGRIINSDCAKMAYLNRGYIPQDPDSVERFHLLANQLTVRLIRTMLFDRIRPEEYVIFMAGGNGSGKSTFCDGIRHDLHHAWVIDAPLDSCQAAREILNHLYSRGLRAVIIQILRSPEEAWHNGVLKCAAHGSHCTLRHIFERTHAVVNRNVCRLQKEFQREDLQVYQVDNP